MRKYVVYMKIPTLDRFETMTIEAERVELHDGSLLFFKEDELVIGFAKGFWGQIIYQEEEN